MPQLAIPLIVSSIIAGGSAIASSAIQANAQKKAAASAEELAKEQQNQALAEQQRLEEKYGLTPGELEREQRLFGVAPGQSEIKMSTTGLEAKQQTELERRAGMSGEDLLKEVGPDTKALLDQIAQRSGMTGEELFKSEGAIPTALQEQILKDVQAPGSSYIDTLNQQLEIARQQVNAEANKRGVFGGTPEGGIRFENLGRAGVDLAIKSASEKMAAKQQDLANASTLATLFQNLSSGARGEQAKVSSEGLSTQDKARAELNAFLENLQNQSASSKGRAAQVASGASQVAAQQTGSAYDTLIGLEAYKGNIESPAVSGLNAISGIASDYAGNLLTTPKTTTSTPSTYDELMKSSGDKESQFDVLGGLSGSELATLKQKYPYLVS